MHRDVKPENFLLDFSTGKALPDTVLTDFGMAKILDATMKLTQTGQFPGGTPQYVAPEQWKGMVTTGATDQYALAIMAYRLLTGSFPFQGPNFPAYLWQHLNEEPVAPSSLKATITQEMDTVILRALSKDPRSRFPSIQDFAQAFQQAGNLFHQPTIVVAPPPQHSAVFASNQPTFRRRVDGKKELQ